MNEINKLFTVNHMTKWSQDKRKKKVSNQGKPYGNIINGVFDRKKRNDIKDKFIRFFV